MKELNSNELTLPFFPERIYQQLLDTIHEVSPEL